jgi:hypothetical protein
LDTDSVEKGVEPKLIHLNFKSKKERTLRITVSVYNVNGMMMKEQYNYT